MHLPSTQLLPPTTRGAPTPSRERASNCLLITLCALSIILIAAGCIGYFVYGLPDLANIALWTIGGLILITSMLALIARSCSGAREGARRARLAKAHVAKAPVEKAAKRAQSLSTDLGQEPPKVADHWLSLTTKLSGSVSTLKRAATDWEQIYAILRADPSRVHEFVNAAGSTAMHLAIYERNLAAVKTIAAIHSSAKSAPNQAGIPPLAYAENALANKKNRRDGILLEEIIQFLNT